MNTPTDAHMEENHGIQMYPRGVLDPGCTESRNTVKRSKGKKLIDQFNLRLIQQRPVRVFPISVCE